MGNKNNTNSITKLPFPFIGGVNNRRFLTAMLAGVIGGAGTSAAVNLLRRVHESINKDDEDTTSDDTIVLNIPKQAEDAYTSMKNAKPGESKIVTGSGSQNRTSGRYSHSVGDSASTSTVVKCSQEGNPGPNTVGTIVANTLGLTAGGILSYDLVSRLFDRLNERRLKRKLEAAQTAYVNTLTGASKRAEIILNTLEPDGITLEKSASAGDALRYPAAAYILALLASTGATAYMTKRVLDREFPDTAVSKGLNKPTRIVFKTTDSAPAIVEEYNGSEKKASDATCAAITALMPVYMDIVEGKPNRTLAPQYVKLAEDLGTDAHGLMKMAKINSNFVVAVLKQHPKALFSVLFSPQFLKDPSKLNFAKVMKIKDPSTYKALIDAGISAKFSTKPDDGLMRKMYNNTGKFLVQKFSDLGGDAFLVEHALKVNPVKTAPVKKAEADDLLRSSYLLNTVFGSDAKPTDNSKPVEPDPEEEKKLITKVKANTKRRRTLSVVAHDENAVKYLNKNKAAIMRALSKLNTQGNI